MKETLKRIEALEATISNANAEIKKLKDELSEPVFEVGGWYSKTKEETHYLLRITKIDGVRVYGYGLIGNDWETEKTHPFTTNIKTYKPATESEVFEALKKEAIKRGFKEGVTIMSCTEHPNNFIAKYCGEELIWNGQDLAFKQLSSGYWISLFRNGKWAEIISEPLTICGFEVKEGAEVFTIGFMIIHKKELREIRDVMTYNRFKTVQFDDYKVTLEEINKLLEL